MFSVSPALLNIQSMINIQVPLFLAFTILKSGSSSVLRCGFHVSRLRQFRLILQVQYQSYINSYNNDLPRTGYGLEVLYDGKHNYSLYPHGSHNLQRETDIKTGIAQVIFNYVCMSYKETY